MLESLAAWVLRTYVGEYVENLNTDQLSIGYGKSGMNTRSSLNYWLIPCVMFALHHFRYVYVHNVKTLGEFISIYCMYTSCNLQVDNGYRNWCHSFCQRLDIFWGVWKRNGISPSDVHLFSRLRLPDIFYRSFHITIQFLSVLLGLAEKIK